MKKKLTNTALWINKSYKLVIIAVFFLSTYTSQSQNDTIVLINNDKLIGEIKNMNNGVLTLKTKYSDSDFKITWLDVIKVNSSQNYLLSLSNGERITSAINTKTGESKNAIVHYYNEKLSIPLKNIVFIKALKSSFFSRFDASLSLGFNYTKSNNLRQFSISSSLGYTGDKWSFTGGINVVRSDQDDVESVQRTDANLGTRYFLKNDWFLLASADFLSNDEQLLKLRSTFRSGLGKYIIHSNRMYFGGGTGLAWNNEQYTTADLSTNNSLEGFLSLDASVFDIRDLTLDSDLTLYPSITESGRIRVDFNVNLKYDLPYDFFVKLSLTYNYDNKPIENASTTDNVFQTTFGWELK